MTYFCPALDPPLDGSGRKTTTLVRDLEYFIHTKFHQNPSSGSGEEVENVNSLTDDGRRTDDGRTDGRRTMHDHNRSLEPLAPVPLIKWTLHGAPEYDHHKLTSKSLNYVVNIQLQTETKNNNTSFHMRLDLCYAFHL